MRVDFQKRIAFIVSVLFLFLIGAMLLTSCAKAEKKELEDVKIKLKWFHQAQFAGNYVALEKGYYADEGINAELYQYVHGEQYIQEVADGVFDFGIAGADELMIARNNGLKVKAIAVIFKTSPVCAYTIDTSIKAPHDFIGKTVGIEKGINVEYLYYVMMRRLNIDRSKINEVGIGFDSSEIPDGIVDVATGYSINEPNVLKEKGYDVKVFLMANYGADTYADVLFTSDHMIEDNPELVQSFVSATLRGWTYVLDNPEESLDYVMKYAGSSREHQEFMLKESIPLIFYDEAPLGFMDYDKWSALGNILKSVDQNLSENISGIYTNYFVENYDGDDSG